MKKTIIAVLVLLVLVLGGITLMNRESGDMNLGFNQSKNGESVAVVNGESITRTDFEAAKSSTAMQQGFDFASLDVEAQQQIESQVLDSLIAVALIRQAAEAEGITVSDAEVQAQIEAIKSQFESDEEFQQILVAEGFTEAELEIQIRSELIANTYIEQKIDINSINVTEEEVEATYAQLTAGQEAPELSELYAQVEQITAQQKSQELVAQLVAELKAEAEVEILI